MLLNKAVYQRMSNEFYKKKTSVLDKGSLGETPIIGFYTFHKQV